MSGKIKPCPFCGWRAVLSDMNANKRMKPKYFVVCTECKAKMGPFIPYGKRPSEKTTESKMFTTDAEKRWDYSCKVAIDEAIKAWNRRAGNEAKT